MTGDPARLQQITWNLIANALQSVPADGKVEVKTSVEGTAAWVA